MRPPAGSKAGGRAFGKSVLSFVQYAVGSASLALLES